VASLLRVFSCVLLCSVLALSLPTAAEVEGARLQHLIEALAKRDYRIRLQAAVVLARLKDRRSVPALITALGDGHPLVRGMVARALGMTGDTRALAPLGERLNDQDAMVRKRAQAAIEQIRKEGVVIPKRPRVLVRLAAVGDKTKQGKSLVPELRRLWAERIEKSPGLQLTVKRRPTPGEKIYEVTSSITELTQRKNGDMMETTCSVSLVLGDHRGSIVMMTSGGATVQVSGRKVPANRLTALQTTALEGAISSAHSNLLRFLASR
jgi:hypothetical protein